MSFLQQKLDYKFNNRFNGYKGLPVLKIILCYHKYAKDTVAKQDENDEVDAIKHSAINAALRLNSIEHHFVPVFARQYLNKIH